jgi:cytochrome c
MFMREIAALAAALLIAVVPGAACAADGPNLGKPTDPADIAAWDTSVMPDGRGLPPGAGTAAQGAAIFAQKCAACHGEGGKGGQSFALLPKGPITSVNAAEKTIGNFWPYSTTLFDYIRRAMPWQQPKSLTSDEVYALTAYLLVLNKVIGESDVMNAESLPRVRMPNRDGFIFRFPEKM